MTLLSCSPQAISKGWDQVRQSRDPTSLTSNRLSTSALCPFQLQVGRPCSHKNWRSVFLLLLLAWLTKKRNLLLKPKHKDNFSGFSPNKIFDLPGCSWYGLPASERDHDRLCSLPLKNPDRQPWPGPAHRGQGRRRSKTPTHHP